MLLAFTCCCCCYHHHHSTFHQVIGVVRRRRSMSDTPGAPSRQSQGPGIYSSPNGKVLLAAVVSLSVVITFVLILHAYARWFLRRRAPPIAHVVRELPLWQPSLDVALFPGNVETRLPNSGLDASVVATLPAFVYKSEDHKNGLDCVVCLSVLEEGEKGRLLPVCKHAFHVGCIDVWLASHSTCPICRAPVRPDESSAVTLSSTVVSAVEAVEEEAIQDGLAVDASSEELPAAASGVVEEDSTAVEVLVGVPINSSIETEMVTDDKYSPSTSSSSSSSPSSSPCSPSSCSLGCSLKRMLSKSRSAENKVFPSALVNER